MEMSLIIYYNYLIGFRGMLQIALLPLLPCKTVYMLIYLTVNLKPVSCTLMSFVALRAASQAKIVPHFVFHAENTQRFLNV